MTRGRMPEFLVEGDSGSERRLPAPGEVQTSDLTTAVLMHVFVTAESACPRRHGVWGWQHRSRT